MSFLIVLPKAPVRRNLQTSYSNNNGIPIITGAFGKTNSRIFKMYKSNSIVLYMHDMIFLRQNVSRSDVFQRDVLERVLYRNTQTRILHYMFLYYKSTCRKYMYEPTQHYNLVIIQNSHYDVPFDHQAMYQIHHLGVRQKLRRFLSAPSRRNRFSRPPSGMTTQFL